MNRKLKQLVVALSSVTLAVTASSALAHSGKRHHHNYKGEAMACPAPCAAPAPCVAAPAPCCDATCLPCGFYVGAEGGYDAYRFNRGFADTLGLGLSSSTRLVGNGGVGGIYGGYATTLWNNFRLAGEIWGQGSNAEANLNANLLGVQVSNNVRTNGSWGVDLLPGWKLNCSSVLYARLGWAWTRFKDNVSVSVDGVTLASETVRRTLNGFHWGVGLETAFCNNLTLRTEFKHTNYNRNHTNALGARTNISNNQVMVGLSYYFG